MTVIGQLILVHTGMGHGAVVVDAKRRALRGPVGGSAVDSSIGPQRAVADVGRVIEPRGIESVDRRQMQSGNNEALGQDARCHGASQHDGDGLNG